MTELRTFTSTQLLISSGFIFVDLHRGTRIAFMRRKQPEIHHGPQMPITMATVGGMFQPLMGVETENDAINAEGFKGRPMSLFENAQMHTMNKLGVWMNPKHEADYNWHVIDHPYYYGERTPDVRNVGKVMRQVYDASQCTELLRVGLNKVNADKPPHEQSELLWMDIDDLGWTWDDNSNHSLKDGEIKYLRALFAGLYHKTDKLPAAIMDLT